MTLLAPLVATAALLAQQAAPPAAQAPPGQAPPPSQQTPPPKAAPAQPPAAERLPQQPTFRIAVDLVTTDVIVRDGADQFVADLKPDEFEVYEDGVKQEIVSMCADARRPDATTR